MLTEHSPQDRDGNLIRSVLGRTDDVSLTKSPSETRPPDVNTGSKQPPSFTTNSTGTVHAQSLTRTKVKKGILGFVYDLLGLNKWVVDISKPSDPVPLTHPGFNRPKFTDLLKDSDVSHTEQGKMGGALETGPPILSTPPPSRPFVDESFYTPVHPFNPLIPAFNADVQQRSTPSLPKRLQQPMPVIQTNSTTPPVIASSSRNTPAPPSDRLGLDRFVSARRKPQQPAHQAHHKSGTGLNSPGVTPGRQEEDKEDDSDITRLHPSILPHREVVLVSPFITQPPALLN